MSRIKGFFFFLHCALFSCFDLFILVSVFRLSDFRSGKSEADSSFRKGKFVEFKYLQKPLILRFRVLIVDWKVKVS